MTTSSSKKKAPAPAKGKTVNSSNIGLWLIGASIALVALVVAVIIFNENQAKSAPISQPPVPAAWINRNVVGSPDAKVVVQLWEDFLCPSCQTFAATAKPQIIDNYVKDGKVRLEYHYFPLAQHDPGATMTALAAECAADQGMFWPYHDRVFQMTRASQQTAATYDELVGYASTMGMDVNTFKTCLSSQQHRDTVSKSLAQAQDMKLQYTPSIIVGETLMQDSSYGAIAAEIDKQLAAAQ